MGSYPDNELSGNRDLYINSRHYILDKLPSVCLNMIIVILLFKYQITRRNSY